MRARSTARRRLPPASWRRPRSAPAGTAATRGCPAPKLSTRFAAFEQGAARRLAGPGTRDGKVASWPRTHGSNSAVQDDGPLSSHREPFRVSALTASMIPVSGDGTPGEPFGRCRERGAGRTSATIPTILAKSGRHDRLDRGHAVRHRPTPRRTAGVSLRACRRRPAQHPRRPVRALAPPAQDPNTSSTRIWSRRTGRTHRTPQARRTSPAPRSPQAPQTSQAPPRTFRTRLSGA